MPYSPMKKSCITMYDENGKQSGLMMKGSVAHMEGENPNDLSNVNFNIFGMPDSSDLKVPTSAKPQKTVRKKVEKLATTSAGVQGVGAKDASVSDAKMKSIGQDILGSSKSSKSASDPLSRKQMKIEKLRMKGERAVSKVKAGMDAGKDVSLDQAQAKHLRGRYDRKVARTARQEERKENRAARRVARKKKAIARKQSKI